MSIESTEDWEGLKQVAKVARVTLDALTGRVHPGVMTAELDAEAARLFAAHGALGAGHGLRLPGHRPDQPQRRNRPRHSRSPAHREVFPHRTGKKFYCCPTCTSKLYECVSANVFRYIDNAKWKAAIEAGL
jgi:hypothetical protein